MSGYYGPPPNSNGYPAQQQQPQYAYNNAGIPVSPGHAPQPNPGYFRQGMYPSQIPPYAQQQAYAQQQQVYPNIPNTSMSMAMSPVSDSSSQRPLPMPRTRPTSVVYPPAMSHQQTIPPPTSSFPGHSMQDGMPMHQRSMIFDPAAYNAAAFNQAQGMQPMQGMPSMQGMQSVQSMQPIQGSFAQSLSQSPHPGIGVRPVSMHFPSGWNPVGIAPTGPPNGPSAPSSLTTGARRVSGTAKKDSDLPPLPPAAGAGTNTSPPMTPGSAIGTGKRALPSAPGGSGAPAIPHGMNAMNGMNGNISSIPSWNPQSVGQKSPFASSPPDKRPLPSPSQLSQSQSLPRISTILPNSGIPDLSSHSASSPAPPEAQTSAPGGGGPSSPTKRALPSAPGGGGIQPGTTPLPTSPPSSIPKISGVNSTTSSNPSLSNKSPLTPAPANSAAPPPTSAPSSYASARSVFSTAPSNAATSFATAPATRPSSYTSPSPPPTGAPRSTASDTGAYSSQGEDKRPLWKRMAAQAGQATSRPQSVFGHRKTGSVEIGGGSSSTSGSTGITGGIGKTKVVEEAQKVTPEAGHQGNASQPASTAGNSMGHSVHRQSPAPTSTPSARHAPLPNPPGRTPSPATAQGPDRSTPVPITAQVPPRQEQRQRQEVPVPPKVVPIAVQPTPIVPYQPKAKASKKPKDQQVQLPQVDPMQTKSASTGSGGISAGFNHAKINAHDSGKVRFSQGAPQAQVQPTPEARTSRSPPTSPPRASAMKKGPKSPPRAEATGSTSHQQPLQSQSQPQQTRPSFHHRHYSQPLAQPHEPSRSHSPPAKSKPPPTKPAPPAKEASPQISMALRFASMDLQEEARGTDKDWAKWALVSSNEVATKPVPLSGVLPSSSPPQQRPGTSHERDRGKEKVRRTESGRRRSASTGARIVGLEDPPPPPAIVVTGAGRRGSFDESSAAAMAAARVDTESMIQAAAVTGGMRRGGARPMPSSGSKQSSPSTSAGHSRVPSGEESYPQYRPSYTDSEDEEEEEGRAGPKIMVSPPPPQISVSSPVDIPSINIEGDSEVDVPGISITIDEPETSSPQSGVPQINAASVPIFSFNGPDEDAHEPDVGNAKSGGKKKHKKEKSVKEEEDERERARQLAKTRPLPPKIKKNSGARCGKCDKIIMGRIVSAMNARWHPECFRCSVCETFLEHVSSYEHDDRPYCHLDYHELFAPRCFHCKTPIMEEHFITLDDDALGKRKYHEQHFFCAECGDPFLTPKQERKTRQLDNGMLEVLDQDDEVGFTVYKGHPYCEACHVRLRMPKCKRCRKSIRPGDQAIEALGGKWCWECFTCNRCSKPFDDPQFYEHDHKPYCQPCYSIILVNQLG